MRQRTLAERIRSEQSNSAAAVFSRWAEALEQLEPGTKVMVGLRSEKTGQTEYRELTDVRIVQGDVAGEAEAAPQREKCC